MAILIRVEPVITGVDPGFVPAAAGGDSFPVDDDTVLHVFNGGGASINVTLVSQAVAEPGIAAANIVVPVAAGARRNIRVRPSARFRDSNRRCQVTYSAVTSVTVAVERIA